DAPSSKPIVRQSETRHACSLMPAQPASAKSTDNEKPARHMVSPSGGGIAQVSESARGAPRIGITLPGQECARTTVRAPRRAFPAIFREHWAVELVTGGPPCNAARKGS